MRLLLATMLTIVLLGGTYLYTSFADSVQREPVELEVAMDAGIWRVEVVRSFDCVPDPDLGAPSLTVQYKGNEVFRSDKPVPAQKKVVIENLASVEQGDNELFVQAHLASLEDFDFESNFARAMKVMVFRDVQLVAEQTEWSRDGEYSISASVLFGARSESTHDDHQHAP